MVNWKSHADRLASEVTHPVSRWRPAVAAVPRHLFVPRWWACSAPGAGLDADVWELCDGPADPGEWLRVAYSDRTLVTQVGWLHADYASQDDRPSGAPTSAATLPSLVVQMLRHARITDDADVLDVGTGSGYGCAVLCERSGYRQVTSIDVDQYLTKAAAERLDGIGLHPQVLTCDATGPLPGSYDRIVSAVAVRPIPASWLSALRPGGRLVTTIAGTTLIITADKTSDGGAAGRTEWDCAGFMPTRSGPDYPPGLLEELPTVRDAEGEHVSTGRYPVVNVTDAGNCAPCSASWLPASSIITGNHPTASAPRGCCTRMGHGPAPSAPTATHRLFTRAARAGCGTSWMTLATLGSGTAPCPSTAPRSPLPQRAQSI
jgi:protein-L-isoaspartate O-methyltransferase